MILLVGVREWGGRERQAEGGRERTAVAQRGLHTSLG